METSKQSDTRTTGCQAPETAFAGWRKVGLSPWRRLCEAASYDVAWEQLLGLGAREGGNGQSVVLPAGQPPDSPVAATK